VPRRRLSGENLDLVVLADARRVPLPVAQSVVSYLRSRGKLIAVGAPAWRTHLAGPKAVCRRAAGAALARVPIPPWLARAEVSILLADDATVRRLNALYRGQNCATDVLSFPLDLEDRDEDGVRILGDVVIAPAVAARSNPADPAAELRLLVVHGILHLLGHDHMDDAGRAEMWARQERYAGVRVP
jgi:probable rRNA maturation factor